MELDSSKWSGEGVFTQKVIDALRTLSGVAFLRVEDAPATRSEADYNFISNEIYVAFARTSRREPRRRFGFLPATRIVEEPAMTIPALEAALTAMADVGAPDFSDEGMIQYLKTERIIPPYQTRGYKIVELIRIYEAGRPPASP
jgi:hypothetical protein